MAAGAASRPEPIDLSGGKADGQGEMITGRHGGPNGRSFYASNGPESHGDPARFHTLAFGLFRYHCRGERRGREATAIHVTDYSSFDGITRPLIAERTSRSR